MNFTLHLTERCNLDCTYCVNCKKNLDMSEEVMYKACDLAFSKGDSAGICFFGGEPLLRKDLIYKAMDYCRRLSEKTGKKIYYKMTTNGTLLDEEFIDTAAKNRLEIGVSFDGKAQDICRRYANGNGTLDDLERISKILLKKMPLSYAMLTLSPDAVDMFCESVEYLYKLGFRRVTATIAYGHRVNWTEEKLDILRQQFRYLASLYSNIFADGKRFFFSPFDSKIRECISGYNPAERCHLGYRQMPVSTEGKLYACTQFMEDERYCFGDVFNGIDVKKQIEIAKQSRTPEECKDCGLKTRCTNSCGCMNRLETGNENTVSPLQCAYERMLIEICDEMAEDMFKKYPDRFRKRYYTEKRKG